MRRQSAHRCSESQRVHDDDHQQCKDQLTNKYCPHTFPRLLRTPPTTTMAAVQTSFAGVRVAPKARVAARTAAVAPTASLQKVRAARPSLLRVRAAAPRVCDVLHGSDQCHSAPAPANRQRRSRPAQRGRSSGAAAGWRVARGVRGCGCGWMDGSATGIGSHPSHLRRTPLPSRWPAPPACCSPCPPTRRR